MLRNLHDLPITNPWFSKSTYKVRSCRCKLVVNMPAAGKLALTTSGCDIKREERHDVARISVENLLVGGICRRAYTMSICSVAKILDMVQYHICRFAFIFVILATSIRRNMGRDTGIDDNIFLSAMLAHWQAPKYSETMTVMQLTRDLAQSRAKYW